MIKIDTAIHNTVAPVRKRETFYRTCSVCVNADKIDEKPIHKFYRVKTEGYPFEVNGYTIYVDKEKNGEWRATEAKTGALVMFGHKTKKGLVMLLEHINTEGFKRVLLDEAEEKNKEYPIVTLEEYEGIRKEVGVI